MLKNKYVIYLLRKEKKTIERKNVKNIICLIKLKYYIEIIIDLMIMYGNECFVRNCYIFIYWEYWDVVKYLGFFYLIMVLELVIDMWGWGEYVFVELLMTFCFFWLVGCFRRRMFCWIEGVYILINFLNGWFWLVNKVLFWKLRVFCGIYYFFLGYNFLYWIWECNKV